MKFKDYALEDIAQMYSNKSIDQDQVVQAMIIKTGHQCLDHPNDVEAVYKMVEQFNQNMAKVGRSWAEIQLLGAMVGTKWLQFLSRWLWEEEEEIQQHLAAMEREWVESIQPVIDC